MALIWIVEDDDSIARLILAAVKKMGHEAERFVDADALEAGLKRDRPDLMLLDLMLRGKDGFAILEEWLQSNRTRRVPVIILSALSSERDKVRGLGLGAEDYITKPFGVRELQARVQTALRRTVLEAREIPLGDLTLRPDAREALLKGESIGLTFREFEVLLYMARRPGQVVTRAMLLQDVWGYPTGEDDSRTVDYHVKMLRQKLRDDPASPRFLETVRGAGYRFLPQ